MNERTHPDPRAWQAWETPPGLPGRELMELLTASAAARAATMLAGGATTVDDPLVDAVRLLATPAGTPHAGTVAMLTGIPEDDVRRFVLAYRHGGPAGVSAALAATACGAEKTAASAREVSRRRAFTDRDLVVEAGAITDADAGVRLRLGPDGRWHPFTFARTHWWPASGADASAGVAYQAAVRAKSLRRASN